MRFTFCSPPPAPRVAPTVYRHHCHRCRRRSRIYKIIYARTAHWRNFQQSDIWNRRGEALYSRDKGGGGGALQMATVRHIHLPFSKKVRRSGRRAGRTWVWDVGEVRNGSLVSTGRAREDCSDSEIPLKRLTDDKRLCHAHSSYSTGPQMWKTTPREKPSPYTLAYIVFMHECISSNTG